MRERQILDLAEELFAERGYEGVSMEELARRAGVTKPVVYALVGNKEALFERCFERAGDDLALLVAESVAEAAGDLERELRAAAGAFFAFIDSHERAWRVLFSLDREGRASAAVAAIRARQSAFVAARLREVAPHVDPERADVVGHLVNGAFETLAHWRRDHPRTATDRLADWLVAFVMPGLEALRDG